MIRGLTLGVCLVAACGGEKAKTEATKGTPVADAAPAAVVTPPAPPPEPPRVEPFSDIPTPDLPAVDLAPVDKKAVASSKKLNSEGLKLHKARDHAAAIAKYGEAIKADPGNLVARHNLACAHAVMGEVRQALGVLRTMDVDGCRACGAMLLHGEGDAELEAVRADPRWRMLVDDHRKAQPPLDELARRIYEHDDKDADLEDYFHPRRGADIVIGEDTERAVVADATEYRAWVASVERKGVNFMRGEKIVCKKDCCTFTDRDENPANTLYVDEVCFEVVGGMPFVQKIAYDDYRDSAAP